MVLSTEIEAFRSLNPSSCERLVQVYRPQTSFLFVSGVGLRMSLFDVVFAQVHSLPVAYFLPKQETVLFEFVLTVLRDSSLSMTCTCNVGT